MPWWSAPICTSLGRMPYAVRLDTQAEGHVLEHRHVAEQRVMLEHKTDLALAYVDLGGVLASERYAARVSRFQPGNDAQQRGLAAA